MNRVEILIRKSFINLLQEKSFYDIHVTDILAPDHISRASFYKYFQDKYDLLNTIESEFMEQIDACFDDVLRKKEVGTSYAGISTNPEVYSALFKFMEEHMELIETLIGPNGDGLFYDEMMDHIKNAHFLLLDRNKLKGIYTPLQWEYVDAFFSYGYLGIIRTWLQTDNRPSSEEMGPVIAGISEKFFHNMPTQDN